MNDFSIFDDARTVENELSAITPVIEQPEAPAARLSSMYSHTSRMKPADRMQMARDMDRAARANIAPMLVGLDEAIEQSQNLDFATMNREAPSVSKFLSSAEGIYAGFDYAGELWKMEKGIRRYNIAPEGSDPWGESLSAYEATLGAIWQGVQDVRSGLSALNADQRNNIYATLNEMGGSEAIDALNMSDEGREILHDIFDSGWVYEESAPESDEYRKKWQERFANSSWGAQLAAEVFRSLPTTAATLAGAAATAPLGVPALGGWLAGAATIYGMSLNQYLSDPDMKDENRARFAAVGNALFQGALEGIGAGRLVRTFTPKSTLGKAFKTWALGAAQEGATEALQVIPDRIFGELAKGGRAEQEDLASLLGEFVAAIPSLFSADVLDEMRHAGLVGALTGGLASAPGNVPSVVEAVKRSRQAAKERAFLVTQTKMAQETPHTLKKVLESVTAEGGAPETVYVKAAEVNGLFQMDDISEQEMNAYLENAGIARQDFDAALAVDGDVSVPFANVHLLMSREDAATMFESLNTTPDDATRGTMEVAEQLAETDNPFGAMDADTLAEVLNVSEEDRSEMLKTASQLAEDADVTEAEQRAEYRQSVKEALITATKGYENAYTERQADAYAQVLDHAVATFAKTYGLTVNQAYSRLAPTFLRETATQQELQDAIDLAVANAAGADAMGVNASLVTNQRAAKAQRVKLEEVNPLYALVKGRLDVTSLARDFPDAAKELKAVHKNRLFKSKANGGLAIDELAAEAVRAGLLPEGSDSSNLVEWLKDERNFRFDAMLQGEKKASKAPAASDTESALNPGVSLGRLFEDNIPQTGGDINTLFQRAWHGTPHRFDYFSLDAIGTGEGAQAHGWGLYFAENRDTSEAYRAGLISTDSVYEYYGDRYIHTNAGWLHESGGYFLGEDDPFIRALNAIEEEGDADSAIAKLKSELESLEEYEDFEQDSEWQELKETLDTLLEMAGDVKEANQGQLFEVEIPDNDVLLDEQKPFEEQPEKVKAALRKLVENMTDEQMEDAGQDVGRIGRQKAAENIIKTFSGTNGERIYGTLEGVFGSPRAASEALNSAGIKGITYEGGRDGRCFVVFDDKAIQILDKLYSMVNGQPLGSYQGLASIDPVALGKGIITFFNGADISTAGHEMGHWFRQVLELGTKMDTATEASFADWKAACDFVGAEYNQPWTVAQEEKFADAFVDYLKQGKAPSKTLRSAFLKLKRWLLDLYERVTNRGRVNCSAEMRRVFDHLLATEAELKAAKEKTSIKTSLSYQDVPADWLGGEAAKRIAQANAEAEASAAEAIHAAMSSELRRNISAWRKEGREIADRNYMQQMFDRIAEAGGLMVTEEVESRYGADVLSAISAKRRGKTMLNRDSGLDLEMLADEMGYTGPAAVDNMVNDMAEAPSKKMLVEQYVQDRLAMWADSFKADEVMLTDEVQTLLAEESAALAGVLGQESVATDELTKQAMKQVMLLEVGNAADGLVALKAAAKAKADKARAALRVVAEYEQAKADNALEKAENRAKRDKAKARAAKQDARRKMLEQAFEAKEKQRRAVAEIRARHAAKELGRKFDRRVKRVLKAKPEQIDFAWHEQIRGLAAMFGIGKGKFDPKGPDAQTLQQFVTALQDEWNTVIPVPQWILETSARGKSWKKLTVGQLSELYDTFVWLEHRGRALKTLTMGRDRIAFDHGVEEMMTSMDSLKSKEAIADYERGRISRKGLIATTRKMMADITLPEYEFDAADGYRKGADRANGVHAQLIVNPMYEAQSRELELQQKMAQEIDAAMAPFRKRRDTKERWAVGGVKLPDDVQKEWGPQWCNYERTVMVALNMGNEGNLKALMRGYGWTRKDLDKITATLSDEDWTMVQKIWDIIDSLYPDLNKSYRALNGIPMSKVEALPLKLTNGRVLKGGYFPLIFDGKFSMTAAKQQEEDAMKNAQAAVVRNVKPKDGFTNARKGGAKPPKLSSSVIGQHLTDSIHYIAFAEPLQQVQRIFNDKRWRAKFSDKFGEAALMELQPWLNNIARPKRPIMTAHESVIEWARHMGTVQALGFNVSSAAMQVTSLSASASEIGWGPLLNGMSYVATHRGEALKLMRELSPMMAQRSSSMTRDIAANLNRLNPDRRTLRWEMNGQTHELAMQDVERAAFAMMSMTDSMVAAPTFFGAYFKALKENGGDERAAVTYAERSVAKAQSSGHTMNLSTLQQDNGIGKLLTMFMTYTMNLQNRMRYQTRGLLEKRISAGAYMVWLANDIIVPACLAVLMKGILESGDVPDDPKKYAKEVGYSVLSGFPLLRGVQSVVEYGMGYSPFSSSINKGFEGPIEMAKSAYKAGMYFYEGNDEKAKAQVFRFVKKSLETAGFVTGTPTKPVLQFFDGAWQIVNGETNNPAALFVKQR